MTLKILMQSLLLKESMLRRLRINFEQWNNRLELCESREALDIGRDMGTIVAHMVHAYPATLSPREPHLQG